MQRIFLLKFLGDEVLNSANIREHLDQCASVFADLQQKLRSLSTEWRNLKLKEEIIAEQVGKVNKEQLPGPEFLQQKSGTKDGQVQMIREADGSVTAHTWSSATQEWIAVGTVVESAGRGPRQRCWSTLCALRWPSPGSAGSVAAPRGLDVAVRDRG